MSSIYSIIHEDGITKVSFRERPDLELAKTVVSEIAANYPYKLRMWNLSNLGFDFTLEEIVAISEYGKTQYSDSSKLAIVASEDLAYGEMRQLASFREEAGKADARVFRTEEEAIDWLKS